MDSRDAATNEHEQLVRFCIRYTGDRASAEDLAQKTLLKAWQHEEQLRDPQARQAWLRSIASHECLTWVRGNKDAQLVSLDVVEDFDSSLADNFDVEAEIERDDLARLLDRAMAMLSPQLRDVLVRRYIEESPQAEIAARLGLSEGAVEARLQRGKLAMRRVLSTELSADALAMGLITRSNAGWQETRLWCPGCGQQRMEGLLDSTAGKLYMRCPICSHDDFHFIHAVGEHLKSAQSIKPALTRVLDSIHTMYRIDPKGGVTNCPICGEPLLIGKGKPLWTDRDYDENDSYFLSHPKCGMLDWESWHSLTWSLPQVQRFWQKNPKMRYLGPREIDFSGSRAVVTGFESRSSNARLEVVSLIDTLEVVRIVGDLEGKGDE